MGGLDAAGEEGLVSTSGSNTCTSSGCGVVGTGGPGVKVGLGQVRSTGVRVPEDSMGEVWGIIIGEVCGIIIGEVCGRPVIGEDCGIIAPGGGG